MRDMKKRLDSRTIETYREMLHADGSTFAERFAGLHSNEQYQILRSFSRAEQAAVFEVISPEAFAQVFKWFSRRRQLKLYGIMAEDYRIRMLERLATDDTRRFIEPMEEADQQAILSRLSPTKRRYMEELLQYDQHSAGSIMRKEFVRGAPEDDVNMMVEKLKTDTTTYEAVHFVYVVDNDQQLIGLVALRDLLIADDSRKLKEICDTSVHTVTVDMDQEQVAHIMQDYDIIAVPVVGADNELLGIITVDDIIDIMEFEATEDVGELTASRGTTDMDVSPFGTARKRAPWIVLSMGLRLITANVIGAFEETLESSSCSPSSSRSSWTLRYTDAVARSARDGADDIHRGIPEAWPVAHAGTGAWRRGDGRHGERNHDHHIDPGLLSGAVARIHRRHLTAPDAECCNGHRYNHADHHQQAEDRSGCCDVARSSRP